MIIIQTQIQTRSIRNSGLRLLAMLLLSGSVSAAWGAATVTVNTTTDSHPVNAAVSALDASGNISLRSAVEFLNTQASTKASPHLINVPPGTYALSLDNGTSNQGGFGGGADDLVVGSATNLGTTINGTGALPSDVIIKPSAGGDVIEMLQVSGNLNTLALALTLQNLEITGCTACGVFVGGDTNAAAGHSVTTINNCIFTGNSDTAFAGGAVASVAGDLIITNSTFSNNTSFTTSLGQGGAIWMYFNTSSGAGSHGSLSISNSSFINNTAEGSAANGAGGAIYLFGPNVAGNTFAVSRCTFDSNHATNGGAGGAIENVGLAPMTVNFCRFTGNTNSTAANGKALANSGSTAGTFTANDNWWGINTGPAANDIANVSSAPANTCTRWLQLRNSASPNSIAINATSTVSADILGLSSGGTTAAANLTGLPKFPSSGSAFGNAQKGTIPGGNVQFTNGAASVVFTGTSGGAGGVDATADGQTLTASITVIPPVTVAPASVPNWTINTPGYSQTITGAGGTGAKTLSLSAGTIPTGMTFTAATGVLSGTPTVASTFNFTITATDSLSATGSTSYTVVVNPAVTVAPATLPDWTVNKTGYSQTVTSANGTGAKTFSGTAGLPIGMSFTPATGVINGTPVVSGTFNFTLTATDTVGATGSRLYTVVINPSVSITTATLPNWTVNFAGYNQTVATAGGTGAITFGVSGGALPTGLNLNAGTGAITGTPTAAGAYSFTLTATDSVGATGSRAYSGTINPAITVAPGSLPDWTINLPGYSQTVAASNGTGALTLSLSAGAIPTGMTFTAGTGVLNGTPTAAGTFNFTITATDSIGATGSAAYTVVVNPAVTVSPATLPDWTVNKSGYSQTLTSANGTGAKTLSIPSGLPTGMTFTPASGVLNGTPTTAGTFNFTLTATDAVGASGSRPYSIVINPPGVITTATLPNWTLNAAGYNQTLATTGGTGAITFGVSGGALPPGLNLNAGSGAITGTPTAAGTFNVTITATDSVGATASHLYTVTVNAAITVAPASLPDWTINLPGYSQTVAASNGTGALTLSLSAGSIPTGMTFIAGTGVLNGTPTAAGTFNFTITATDTIGATGSAAYAVVVNPAVTVSPATLPNWTINKSGYSQTITSSNGTGAKTFSITAGSIPAGMTFTAGTGVLDGTPTTAGTFNFTLTTTDSVGATGSTAYTIVINPPVAVTTAALPNWTVNSPGYNQALAVTGGTGADTFTLSAGALPAGLSLNAGTGAITGTPTAASTSTFTITATDTVAATGAQAYTVAVNPALAITTATLPNWTANFAYAQTVATTGGTNPVGFSVTAGSLPAGLGLNAATGAISGNPTSANTSNFTLTATDAAGASSASVYSVTINPAIVITTAALPAWTINKSGYNQILAVTGGTGADSFALSTGSLPAGLSLNVSTGAITGTPSAPGSFSFSITATDTLAATATKAFTVVINPAITLAPATLPNTIALLPGYNQAVIASNGTGAATFAITSGALPPGLAFTAATGIVSGTPSAIGVYPFSIGATDSVGATGSVNYSITVAPNSGPPVITSSTTVGGIVGSAFNFSIVATNGATSYTATGLPNGLSLNTTSGIISGTPTAPGSTSVALSATNLAGPGIATLTIFVAAPTAPPSGGGSPTPVITSPLTASGSVGSAFSYIIAATNIPLLFRAVGLPAGLNVNAGSGAITGTPTLAGTFTVNLSASNASGLATEVLTLTIATPPSGAPAITPAGNPTVLTGTPINVTLGNSPGTTYTATGLPTGVTLDPVTGIISGTPTVTGVFDVNVTATNPAGSTATTISLTIPNQSAVAPVIMTPVLLSTSALVGLPAVFASTADQLGVTWSWNFGDGTPAGSGNLVGHIFAAPGTYTITVTATNLNGQSSSQTVIVTVFDAPPGSLSNFDTTGSGFPAEILTALNLNLADPGSTPFGGASAGTPVPLTLTRLAINLNFATGLSDYIVVTGVLPIPDKFSPSGQQVVLDVAGAVTVFVLDAKGRAVSGKSTLGLRLRTAKSPVRFSAVLRAPSQPVTNYFRDENIVKGKTNRTTRTVPVIVLFTQKLFRVDQPENFISNGISGHAHMARP